MAITQTEAWFKLADEDRDGVVGGAEAVKFFLKSGLPQEALGQVMRWTVICGGTGCGWVRILCNMVKPLTPVNMCRSGSLLQVEVPALLPFSSRQL